MSNLPRLRYTALVAVLALALAYVPGLGDVAGLVLRNIGLAVAGLMAVAKVIREAMASIDAGDPMVRIQDGHIVSRGTDGPGFWRRLL